jgi:hypothetical protein
MHAIFLEVEIDGSRRDEAATLLRNVAVPAAQAADGFVGGYWLRAEDGTYGRAAMLFDTEQAARAALQSAPAPPEGAPVKLLRAEVFEVLATA